ncbi:MAG: hypothetical protein WC683_04970 [bacterium]
MKIDIAGTEFELVTEPTHGSVRALRLAQKRILMDVLEKYKDKLLMTDLTQSVQAAFGEIFKFDPMGLLREVSEAQAKQEDFNIVATFTLATNHAFSLEDLDAIPEAKIWEIMAACTKAIGGDANDFFRRYAPSSPSPTK